MTWDFTHDVANRYELVTLQLLFVFVGFVFVSGDFYLTIQGLRGFLAHKPIMTYDLAAGYERQKLIVFIWTTGAILALIYPDVVCVYNGSTSLVWFFAIFHVGTFYNSLVLGVVSRMPSRFMHVVIFSPSTMNQIVFSCLEIVHMCQLRAMLDHYESSLIKLGLNISAAIRPSGAYDVDNARSTLVKNDSAAMTLISSTACFQRLLPSISGCQ
ncbi:hypothetical protein AC1031_012460 [Aphanomyces cochlioides]|nr:hypothetical protein AC1031_012460 [Aphanomyces cochlioides]